MNILELMELLNASALNLGSDTETVFTDAFSSDMMSDILAHAQHGTILITGLCNPQVMRTAEMIESECIVFVRGKIPTDAMVELAKERDMHVLVTNYSMFNACGLLYSSGKIGGVKFGQ